VIILTIFSLFLSLVGHYRDFIATAQAIGSFAVMDLSVAPQLQYIVDHANAAQEAERPSSSLAALRRAVTPSEETRQSMGRLSSILGIFFNYLGGQSKRKMDLVVACLEDDEGLDDSKLYGGGTTGRKDDS